ncbi:hypothetical protein HDV05_002774 [Chytridiales sp. JEL 0842]|nr:hypothetical protein HDV05_002774 [Chytridiales sp. JEL 0842]
MDLLACFFANATLSAPPNPLQVLAAPSSTSSSSSSSSTHSHLPSGASGTQAPVGKSKRKDSAIEMTAAAEDEQHQQLNNDFFYDYNSFPARLSPFLYPTLLRALDQPSRPPTRELLKKIFLIRRPDGHWDLYRPPLSLKEFELTTSDPEFKEKSLKVAGMRHIRDLVQRWDYPFEEHHAPVEHGQVHITLHRIPHPPLKPNSTPHTTTSTPQKRPPILIWHGLGLSSNIWVCCPHSPASNFAFYLVNAGFDVWMGNTRGNGYTPIPCYTTHHKKPLGPIDEMAYYDIPGCVEYILRETGFEKMSYVGYSQGTTGVLGGLSLSEELNDKLEHVICLAPALRPKSLHSKFSKYPPSLLYTFLGTRLLLPNVHHLLKTYVPPHVLSLGFQSSYSTLFKWKSDNLGSPDRKVALFANALAGVSIKNLVHWGQIMHPENESLNHYKRQGGILGLVEAVSSFAPESGVKYPTMHITAPLHLFVGTTDPVSDLNHLKAHLPPHTQFHQIPEYCHMDFMWAVDLEEKLWKDLVRILKSNAPPPLNLPKEVGKRERRRVWFAEGTRSPPPTVLNRVSKEGRYKLERKREKEEVEVEVQLAEMQKAQRLAELEGRGEVGFDGGDEGFWGLEGTRGLRYVDDSDESDEEEEEEEDVDDSDE